MATVRDVSGNNPLGDTDHAIGGHYDLQATKFLGDQHPLILGAASVQSPVFSRQCRAIRLAPEGNCHYLVSDNPTAVKDATQFLASGAVEILTVRGGTDRIAVIQDAAEMDLVMITEDKS